MSFFDKAKRKMRYQGETEASQLGWHPTERPPSSTAFPIRSIIKKREKYIQEGGLGLNPQKQVNGSNKKEKNLMETVIR